MPPQEIYGNDVVMVGLFGGTLWWVVELRMGDIYNTNVTTCQRNLKPQLCEKAEAKAIDHGM